MGGGFGAVKLDERMALELVPGVKVQAHGADGGGGRGPGGSAPLRLEEGADGRVRGLGEGDVVDEEGGSEGHGGRLSARALVPGHGRDGAGGRGGTAQLARRSMSMARRGGARARAAAGRPRGQYARRRPATGVSREDVSIVDSSSSSGSSLGGGADAVNIMSSSESAGSLSAQEALEGFEGFEGLEGQVGLREWRSGSIVEERPSGPRPMEEQPVEEQSVGEPSVAERSVAERSVEERSVEDSQSGPRPAKEKPAGKRPSKQRPAAAHIHTEEAMEEEERIVQLLARASTARQRRVRNEDGDWMPQKHVQGRTISHDAAPAPAPGRAKRARAPTPEPEAGEDPFRLVQLQGYEEAGGAPLSVAMSTEALLVMDLHAHVHASEVIGLLGGTVAVGAGTCTVTCHGAFPCARQQASGTAVDVDPLSAVAAGEHFEARGWRVVGWYHSHPDFEPSPSVRDIETQALYQALAGAAHPYVGVIVNPYGSARDPVSHVECFHVATDAATRAPQPFRLPLRALPGRDPAHVLPALDAVLGEAARARDRVDLARGRGPGAPPRWQKLLASLCAHGQLQGPSAALLAAHLRRWADARGQ